MNNTHRVFKELKKKWSELSKIYKPTDKIAIGVRYHSNAVISIKGNFSQIGILLTMCFDGKHPEVADIKDDKIVSIFITDATGTTFYDSNTYKASKNKYSLKTDRDTRILKFSSLDEKEKESLIELTTQQIHGYIDTISIYDDLNKDKSEDLWGEMPW